jgi:hypothetical protein
MLSRSGGILPAPNAAKVATYSSRVNMDAHLIGIDLAQLLLKHNARIEKQRPIKAAKAASDSAMVEKETRTESH